MIGLARCPFFAHLDQPLMQKYIKMHIAKYGEDAYPTDWACMHYDAIYGLEQKITEIGSIETEAVRKGLKSATLDTAMWVRFGIARIIPSPSTNRTPW